MYNIARRPLCCAESESEVVVVVMLSLSYRIWDECLGIGHRQAGGVGGRESWSEPIWIFTLS